MQKKKNETIDFLNVNVDLPGGYKIPNWLKIIIWNSSPSPFQINRNDMELFDSFTANARVVPEHEAIIRLLGMLTYQAIQTKKLEDRIARLEKRTRV